MIAFGSAITETEDYRRYARPGIERSMEPGSEVLAFAAAGAISRGCNLLLEAARGLDGLEALVIVDQALEVADPDVCAKIRRALAEPDVAVVGCAGARGVRTIAWWDYEVSAAAATHRFHEHGGGDLPALAWTTVSPPPADVDMVDGRFMVLSPWAVANLSFEEGLTLGHGYDLDYCMRARAAGRRVRTADIGVIRHDPLELVAEPDLWVESHVRFAERWDGQMPGVEPDERSWKQRARHAEAERDAARTVGYSENSRLEAELRPLRHRLEAIERTAGWRITEPLRWLNRRRRERAGEQP